MVLVKNCIDAQIIPQVSYVSADIECLTLTTRNYVYAVMYRPPDSSVNTFISSLEELLNYVNDNNLKLILGGDLNINILESSAAAITFVSTVESSGYDIVTETPTRITPTSETLIDLFITNVNKDNVENGVICCDISDHFALYFVTESAIKKSQTLPARTVQNITPHTLTAFSTSLSQTDWSAVYHSETADLAYETFLIIFKKVYFRQFKEKVLQKCRRSRKPWIDRECLRMIEKNSKLFRRFLKTKDASDLTAFK